jgi:hypothetical protein
MILVGLSKKKINLTPQIPSAFEVNEIRNYIAKKTVELTGDNVNISKKPIFMTVYSPTVPNLTLVDLPGIVAFAKKDQPANIKEQIEELITSYVSQPKTIILAIMQSNVDRVTDAGLALIKRNDCTNRTIGVLTKPDLMNAESHVGDYLINNITPELKLQYGYYVVKNRSNDEVNSDILKGLDSEKKYFSTHVEYQKPIYKNKIGYSSLIENIKKILVSSIQKELPAVLSEITILDESVRKKLLAFGSGVPIGKDAQLSEINLIVNNFNTRISECIESEGTLPNIGLNIKRIFDKYKSNLDKIIMFDSANSKFTNDYFLELRSNFEGYHISNNLSKGKLLEKCMSDVRLKPIHDLRYVSIECLEAATNVIVSAIKEISLEDRFSKYPELMDEIIKIVSDNLIVTNYKRAENEIDKIIIYESNYIWADDEDFRELLDTTTEESLSDPAVLRELLESYFVTVKKNFKRNIPKFIMTEVVRSIQTNFVGYAYANIVRDDKVGLLKENLDVERQRGRYLSLKNRIHLVRSSLTNK